MALKLILGNKNYSSWSMRPWIAMRVAGIAFEEEVISLDAQDFKARVTRVSGTGKVPALADGDVQVWERSRSSNTWLRNFPPRGCGRRTPGRAHTRVRSPPRCTPASFRCAATCR
jgi:glutathione S-transferase